jgi:hypothetical protein
MSEINAGSNSILMLVEKSPVLCLEKLLSKNVFNSNKANLFQKSNQNGFSPSHF